MISETTLSSSTSFIPRTPVAVRPIGRTHSSAKRTTLPSAENSMASLLPSVKSTPISSSPSFKLTAIIPALRGRLKSCNGVFLTVPLAVAIKTNLPSSYSLTGRIAVIRSSCSRGNKLIIGRPRAPRLASGN